MTSRDAARQKEQLAQQVVLSVSKILAEDLPSDEALRAILKAMCVQMHWTTASFWTLDEHHERLHCEMTFYRQDCPQFEQATKELLLESGIGLPGRVWQEGRPVWIPDVVADSNFPRAAAAKQDGLHAAFAFPMSVRGKFIGVFELFSKEVSEPDTDLLDAFVVVGTELGQFFERRRIESELIQSEGRFREFAKVVDEVFFVGSAHLTEFYYVSPAYEKIWGEPTATVLSNPQAWARVVVPEHRERVTEYVKLLSGDNMPDEVEIDYAIIRADGRKIWLSARCFRIEQEDGSWQICGTVRDITDRKMAEERMTDFYSMLSHELRTPLTSIKGSLLLMERGKAGDLGDRAQELILLASKECDRLIRMTNDFLDIRTMQVAKLQICKEALTPEEIVEPTIDALSASAEEAKVKLEAHIKTKTIVFADKDRIVQVITNLVSNAVKFSPPNSTVSVRVEKTAKTMRFSVSDNGPGIAKSDQSKLFKVFHQIDTGQKQKQGTGLGLAISKGIIDEHGGKIGVISDRGKGSTFWFELPLETIKTGTKQ